MSKRKTKKQQQKLEDEIKLILLLIAFGTWYVTKNLVVVGISVCVAFIAITGIFIYQKRRRTEQLRKSGIAEIDKMDGIQFEYYLKELFLSRGFSVEVTKAAGDYGGDLLLKQTGKKIVVQAKRHNKDVGIKAVQEVIGAKAYYSADEAWVVTNSYFTKAAIELAQKSGVRLVNRENLIDYILEMNPADDNQSLQLVEDKVVPNQPELTCSRCGSPLVLRKGKRGNFYGCSSFPKCRFTKNVG